MILLFGLVMALICGLLAASKAGFVSSWTRLLNTAVAVYLAVYLTPTLGSSFAFIGEHPYGAVLCALAVALVTFIGLNAICGLILGDLKIEIAKVVDAVGGGVMGFVNGLLLWGFICLLLWISPVADFVMDGHISSRDEVQQMWYSSIGTNMAVMNAVTFQSRPQPLSKVVDLILREATPLPKPAPKAPEQPETEQPDSGYGEWPDTANY